MAAFAAFILAAAATAADVPRPAAPARSVSATATVTIIRAERVSASDNATAASRSIRREAGKIAVDFH